jgi:hypothetical protein
VGQQDGAAGERGHSLNLRLARKRGLILGVVGGFGADFFGTRTRRELGVGLISGDLRGRGHGVILVFGLNASMWKGENEP